MNPSKGYFKGKLSDENTINREDIIELKRKKQNLEKEREELKIKINRFENEAKRGVRGSNASPSLLISLDEEIKSIENTIRSQKKEIQSILMSDTAAECQELKVELNLLNQEESRLNYEIANIHYQIEQSQIEIKELLAISTSFSKKELDDAITKLEREIFEQEKENHKLFEKLEAFKDSNSLLSGKISINSQIEHLIGQIEKISNDTREIQAKKRLAEESHYSNVEMILSSKKYNQPIQE